MNIILDIILPALILIAAGLLAYLLIYFINYIFGSKYNAKGVLLLKNFVPAHTEIILVFNGTTSLPQPIYYADSWDITLNLNNSRVNGNVKNDLSDICVDEEVSVFYKKGGLFGDTIIEEVY